VLVASPCAQLAEPLVAESFTQQTGGFAAWLGEQSWGAGTSPRVGSRDFSRATLRYWVPG
jgi:hypothetical protein